MKSLIIAWMGDFHIGHRRAPAPKWGIDTMRGRDRRISAHLSRCLSEHIALLRQYARSAELAVMFGGEFIEGRHHERSELWAETLYDQRNAAVELLRPLVNAATFLVAQTGTPVHAGMEGEDDRTVAEMIGADLFDPTVHATPFPGGHGHPRLDVRWWHHGSAPSRDPWGRHRVLVRAIERAQYSDAPPDAVIWHHVHVAPSPVKIGKTWAGIVPAWKWTDEYGRKVAPGSNPTIGGLVWWPAEGRMELIEYAPPKETFALRAHRAAVSR